MRSITNKEDVQFIINTIKKCITLKEGYNPDNTENIDVVQSDRHGVDRLAECIFEYYLNRTQEHIQTVQMFAKMIADKHSDREWSAKLLEQAKEHDKDKLTDREFMANYAPYIVSKYGPEELKCNFELTAEYKREWDRKWVVQHCKNNKHHPEYWDKSYDYGENKPPYTPKMMDEVSMAEAVCDWMSVGYEQGNSATDWFKKNNGTRWIWSNSQKTFIRDILKDEASFLAKIRSVSTESISSTEALSQKSHHLYTYVPKNNTVAKDGLYGPCGDSEKNLVERYGYRAKSNTKEGVLKWLDSLFPNRSKSISVLTEPIPDSASQKQKAFRDNSVLVVLPSYEELKKLGIAVDLYRPHIDGPGSDHVKDIDYSPIPWSGKEGKLTFSGIKHYFIVTKTGYIPPKYCNAVAIGKESLIASTEVLPAKYKNLSLEDNSTKKKLHSLADPYYTKIGSHGWNHINEVLACAYELKGRKPLTDLEYAIIVLHDIGRSQVDEGHAELSEKIARKILPKQNLFSDEELELIYSGILEHSKSYRKANNIIEFSSEASELMTNADRGFPAVTLEDLVQRPILWILEGSDKGTPVEKEYNYYQTDEDIANRVLERLHHYFDDELAKAKSSTDLWHTHFLPELKKRDQLLKKLTVEDILPFVERYRTEYGFESLDVSTESLPANFKEKRKKIEKYILDSIKLLDPHTDVNTSYWSNKFKTMSDNDFDKMMNLIKEKKYNIHMFVPPLKVHLKTSELIEASHKLGVKLMHRIWMTDEGTGLKYLTPEEYLVLQLPVRRQQQYLDEKISVPDDDKTIDALTGQVTGDSKSCAITNPEIHIMQARNLDASLYEFVNVRGGNIHNYAEYKRALEETGSVSLNQLDPNNKTRVSVMGQVLLTSMGLDANIADI